MTQSTSIHSFEIEYYPSLPKALYAESINVINNNKAKWQTPFFSDTTSYLDLEKIETISAQFLSDDTKNVIVLGTGGSIQTLLALKHLAKKEIFPITSSRTRELKACLEETSPKDSVVIPISRSGNTLDVNSTIGTFVNRKYPFLGISSRGTMREVLEKSNAPILEVPDLSGRFAASITNVAIVPAFISGIDIKKFLKGLKAGYDEFMNPNKSRALQFAAYLYNLYKKGYKIVFSMPYSQSLEGSVGLFVQELSESTGKEGKGLMGAYQEAPLCQHSVLEYLLGGTKGAVVPLLYTVNQELEEIKLSSSIEYLDKKNANAIINYQADATFQALLDQNIPSGKLAIESPTEHNIGILIAFIQSCVYYLCLLLNVNWANNPMVNIGKEICNEALKKNLAASERKKVREKIVSEKFNQFFK